MLFRSTINSTFLTVVDPIIELGGSANASVLTTNDGKDRGLRMHYYEAAEIDGANSWQVFRHITLPLVSPTLFFLSMIAVIGTFKAFNHIYILRTPGARDSVDVLSIAIFDQIFEFHNAGYASAMAFVLFVAILGLTFLQNRALGKRVFYGD